MLRKGRAILRHARMRRNRLNNGDGNSNLVTIATDNINTRASNSWSAIKDTFFSTKQVFENNRLVFTVGTSVASILTAWAGYSLRQIHEANVEKRLESLEECLKRTHNVEHEEVKKIVTSGNVSTPACVATAGSSLIIGYFLGWRGGVWFARRKFRKEQLKLLSQMKPKRWQFLRSSFTRLRNAQTAKRIAEAEHQSSVGKDQAKPSSHSS